MSGIGRKAATGSIPRTRLKDLIITVVAITPGSVGAGAQVTVTPGVTGITTSHQVIAWPQQALETGLVPIASWASAANTVSVVIYNPTAAAVTGATKNWVILAWIP
jgi:hypothetical protein